ncbi:hypothetical protein BN1708_002228 [Verticillium longisporum]|uniref:Uncharacterized protein n=1 Tax=Verticillium longisporum TaxID=100787 RepID=A0A0G4KLC9_VERLO|nr:hypothetical protein BN1708_002228 [Verticillium longisporum]
MGIVLAHSEQTWEEDTGLLPGPRPRPRILCSMWCPRGWVLPQLRLSSQLLVNTSYDSTHAPTPLRSVFTTKSSLPSMCTTMVSPSTAMPPSPLREASSVSTPASATLVAASPTARSLTASRDDISALRWRTSAVSARYLSLQEQLWFGGMMGIGLYTSISSWRAEGGEATGRIDVDARTCSTSATVNVFVPLPAVGL